MTRMVLGGEERRVVSGQTDRRGERLGRPGYVVVSQVRVTIKEVYMVVGCEMDCSGFAGLTMTFGPTMIVHSRSQGLQWFWLPIVKVVAPFNDCPQPLSAYS